MNPIHFVIELLREKLAVNRAVAYLLIARVWQFLAAPVTVYLIYKYFSPTTQGDYYLFGSLLAAQTFFELGLNNIIILMASHEWASLKQDGAEITGSPRAAARLAAVGQFGNRWYLASSLLFFAGAGSVGGYLIANGAADSAWFLPWWTAVLINSLSLLYQPRIALLEGCNFVSRINFYRFLQTIVGSLVVWLSIVSGGELWTIAFSNLVRWAFEMYMVHISFGSFFRALRLAPQQGEMSWREEIWPLQWRLAGQSLGGYFSSYFFIPVVSQAEGKVAAGQLGMTWSVLTALQSASMAWIQTRMPEFGIIVASKGTSSLEKRMIEIGRISIAVLISGGVFFVLGLWTLELIKPSIAARFIAIRPTLIFLNGMIAFQIAVIQHSYVRLHKKDPYLTQNLIATVMTAGFVWWLGHRFGVNGIASAYCGIAWLYTLPVSCWILVRFRGEFLQAQDENKSESTVPKTHP